MAVLDVVSSGCPACVGRGFAVDVDVDRSGFGSHVGDADIETVPTCERCTIGAVRGDEDTWVRVLKHPWPNGNVAIAIVTTLPCEGFWLRPARFHEQRAFLSSFARLPRIVKIREVLVGCAPQHCDAESTFEQVVEHRVFLGDTHRVRDRKVGAKNPNLLTLESFTGQRGKHHGIWRDLFG